MEPPGQMKVCRVIPSEDGSMRAGRVRERFSWAIISPAGGGNGRDRLSGKTVADTALARATAVRFG